MLLVGLDLRVTVAFGPDVPDTLRLAAGHRLGPWFGAFVPVVTTVATSAVLALR